MHAATRKALVSKLSIAKNFHKDLAPESRIWFVDKVIRVFEGVPGATDAQVTQKTTDLVMLAKTRVTAECDFAMNLKADGNKRFNAGAMKRTRNRRVQILYGAIAHEPKLTESGQRQYLLFVARRRFRVVCRMQYWVNPNSQGYFRYPYTCPTDRRWRVNEDAAFFWEQVGAAEQVDAEDVLIKMNAAGVADPVTAVQKLWVPKRDDACKGNLFDCAVTADITFIDSLLEARTPDTFVRAMPAEYLKIKHIDLSEFAKQVADTKNPVKRVPVLMPPRDLQVGDHCYIYNHPLYKTFRPTGLWRGEFSFVFSTDNRDYRSHNGFLFGGHDLIGTLYQLYDKWVKELATKLAIARQLAKVHLAYMASGQAAIAPSTANEIEDDVEIYDPIVKDFFLPERYRLIEYPVTVLSRDFTKVPTRAKRKRKSEQPGFLVLQSKAEHTFYFVKADDSDEDKPLMENLKKKITDIPGPTRQAKYTIKIERVEAPDAGSMPVEVYAIEKWGVAIMVPGGAFTDVWDKWPFFKKVDDKWKRNELTTDKRQPSPDLFAAPFSPFTTVGTDVRVDLPRIDFGAHRTFLFDNGAI